MADAARTRSMRAWRAVARGVLIALVLAVAVGVLVLWERRGGGAAAPAGGGTPPPLEVSVIEVRPRSVPLTPTYLGRTEASQVVEIRARVSGFLEERAFEEGTRVEPGRVLYRIDPRPFQAELAVARARVENARARLERAGSQLARLRSAAASAAASPAELEEWETEERVAAADVRLEEARAVQAELDLGYATIESPIAGVIGQSLKDVGSYVQPGAEGLLAVVQQIDPIYVEFSLSEGELLNWQRMIAAGRVRVPRTEEIPLSLELANGSVYPTAGRINYVAPQVDPGTGTAIVRGAVPNPEGLLRPGQFARVSSLGIERLNAVLVPQSAVVQSPAGASVYVVGPGSTAEVRPVELGEWHGDSWVITSGLSAGDRVVVDRIMQLRPGAALVPRVVEPAAGGADAAAGRAAPAPPAPAPTTATQRPAGAERPS